MTKPTIGQTLKAIESGSLTATMSRMEFGRFPQIELAADQQQFGIVRLLDSHQPEAVVVGNIVRISDSPPLNDSFDLECKSEADALKIAASVNEAIGKEYAFYRQYVSPTND